MKIIKLAFTAVALMTLAAGTSFGQSLSMPAAYQNKTLGWPGEVRPAGAYGGYFAETPEAAAPSEGSTDAGQVAAQSGAEAPAAEPVDCNEPWQLPEPCVLKQHGWEWGGWVESGVYTNAHGAEFNGPLGLQNLTDYNLYQLWFYMQKPVKTDSCDIDWGGRIDYLFGIDGPDIQSFNGRGWDSDWDSSRDYGSAMQQAYAELGWNNWSLKVGHFATAHGQEVSPAKDNFFFSHTYTWYYGEPLTHTGVMATYTGIKDWTLYAGWTEGWDTGFESPGGASTFLGGLSYNITDKASLAYAVSAGSLGDNIANEFAPPIPLGDVFLQSIILKILLTERMTWITHSDFGVQSDLPGGDVEWGGIAEYFQYTINDCWAAGLRWEWFSDEQGGRVIPGLTAGDYYGLTAGLNWRPDPNLIVRPELRYDWFNGTGVAPFNDGQDDDQLSGGFDVIFTF